VPQNLKIIAPSGTAPLPKANRGSMTAHGASETQNKRPIQAIDALIGAGESDWVSWIDTLNGF
jgi:hypothetical protein